MCPSISTGKQADHHPAVWPCLAQMVLESERDIQMTSIGIMYIYILYLMGYIYIFHRSFESANS